MNTFKFEAKEHDGKPSLFWHRFLDWILKGKLKVVWDEKLGIYVGKLVR